MLSLDRFLINPFLDAQISIDEAVNYSSNHLDSIANSYAFASAVAGARRVIIATKKEPILCGSAL